MSHPIVSGLVSRAAPSVCRNIVEMRAVLRERRSSRLLTLSVIKGITLDKLEVIYKAEKLGGQERRSSLEHVMIAARELGCDMQIGGGRAGGVNIRYGSIGYALMDVNTEGLVKLYVQPHPGKSSTDEFIDELNSFIDDQSDLEPKSFPINSYSHLEDLVEDIPNETLSDFLEFAMEKIREEHYAPYLEV